MARGKKYSPEEIVSLLRQWQLRTGRRRQQPVKMDSAHAYPNSLFKCNSVFFARLHVDLLNTIGFFR